MDRRKFLTGTVALFATPAIVKFESIMPIRRIIPPRFKYFEAAGFYCPYIPLKVVVAEKNLFLTNYRYSVI